MNEEIKLTKREPTWNYILNDLALYSLMTKVIHSEDATYQEKFDLMYQIELLQKQNKELKDNWNKLKEWLKEGFDYERGVVSEDFIEAIENTLDKMQEIEEKNDKRNMETN